MSDFKADDVNDWLRDPVTIELLGYIKRLLEQTDVEVHKLLNGGHLDKAAYENAIIEDLTDILNYPEHMIDELRENGENDTTNDRL